ncbi:MAG TPA: hypothetical protein VN748_13550, partial [Pseudonocardiaceae bacterium]|nr:hypothetical protein [Pseudonocardiaceae bacterium]
DECEAAKRLQPQDPRLREALDDPDYNVTEVLAGARELVRRYEQATNEQQAILNAALDARRLGIQAPLTEQLLAAAARGYPTTVHPGDAWLRPVLAELTRRDRASDRAIAPLIRVSNPDRVLGYTVADYLLQRFTRQRRSNRLSAETWQALIDHTQDQNDLLRLALSADRRLLHRYAEHLYRRFVNVGHTYVDHRLVTYAAHRLADLRVRRKAPDQEVTDAFQILIKGARSYVERISESGENCRLIVRRLIKQGRHELAARVLQDWKDAGDRDAAQEWTNLLIEHDRTDQAIPIVRTLIELRHEFCITWWFQRLLTEQDQPDKAMTVLRATADAGGADAARKLAQRMHDLGYSRFPPPRDKSLSGSEEPPVELWFDRFARQGRTAEILPVLRAVVDAGGQEAGELLADLLAKHGDSAALAELRARADAEQERDSLHDYFDRRLADLLAEQGGEAALAELRARADHGSWRAAFRLADLLAEQGGEAALAELRARADDRDEAAGKRLAKLLVDRGDIEELRARAAADDKYAAEKWAELLIKQNRIHEAIPIVRTLAGTARWHTNWLVSLLHEHGDIEEAIALRRAQAEAGDEMAAWAAAEWAELLIEQDRTDQAIPIAKALVNTTKDYIVDEWCQRLAEQGRAAEAIRVLRACADAGGETADQLVEMLIAQNRVEEALDVLRTQANADHDRTVADRLARLLVKHRRVDELRARADDDDLDAELRLLELLAQQGDDAALAELRTRANHGSWPAAVQLADLLAEQGDEAALTELRARANGGDQAAGHRLTKLLAEQGDEAALTELRERADADDDAARELAELLAKHGDEAALAELQDRADAGDDSAAWWLAELLAQQGRLDKLRARTDAGDGRATERLITLLAQQGTLDELWEEVDAGTPYVGRRLINLLDQLCEPEQAGQRRFIWEAPDTLDASEHLIEELLHRIGGIEQGDGIRSFGLNPDCTIADRNPAGHQPQSGTRR